MNCEIWLKGFARGNSYWLTRFVILRLLGLFMRSHFLVAAQQLVPLIGSRGITPAWQFLSAVHAQLGSRTQGMLHFPTVFWFGLSDQGMTIFAWVGFALSLIVLAGYANAIIMTLLWAMYMSIVHIGGIWYGYGWEIQLLETGFFSIFLCPLLDGRPFPKTPPPILVIWLVSLARFPHHGRRRSDQAPRRSLLARSHLPLLSLRNTADPESDQPLFEFLRRTGCSNSKWPGTISSSWWCRGFRSGHEPAVTSPACSSSRFKSFSSSAAIFPS